MDTEGRLEKLEKSLRRWRDVTLALLLLTTVLFIFTGCVIGYVLAVGYVPGSSLGGVVPLIRTQQLQIVDSDEDDAKAVAVVGFTEQGSGYIVTRENDGTDLVKISAFEDGGGVLDVYDKHGRPSAGIQSGSLAIGRMYINDDRGTEAVSLDSDGIEIHGTNPDNPAVSLGRTAGGAGIINTFYSDGKMLVSVAPTRGGGGSITVMNDLGKEVVGVQAGKNDAGLVFVADEKGEFQEGLSGSD